MEPLANPVGSIVILINDDEIHQDSSPSEDTPLLPKPPSDVRTPILVQRQRNQQSMLAPIFIGIMMFILITGVAIGVYLLLEEEEEWPVNIPFDMITREKWGAKLAKSEKPLVIIPPRYVVLTHTATPLCNSYVTCQNILLGLQDKFQNSPYNMSDIPFNFMISSDGETYEGRGWNIQGDIHPILNNNSISIGIIGNFSINIPYKQQLEEAQALIDESIRRNKLLSTYRILGANFSGVPTTLNSIISSWPHWSNIP